MWLFGSKNRKMEVKMLCQMSQSRRETVHMLLGGRAHACGSATVGSILVLLSTMDKFVSEKLSCELIGGI